MHDSLPECQYFTFYLLCSSASKPGRALLKTDLSFDLTLK